MKVPEEDPVHSAGLGSAGLQVLTVNGLLRPFALIHGRA